MVESGKAGTISLLVGTRKGVFLHADPAGSGWIGEEPHFLGSMVNQAVLDPRDGRTLLMAAKPGHIGPTVFRREGGGGEWVEANGWRRKGRQPLPR